jgi:DNA-binding transcriptional LysR family regulator
MLYRRIRCFLEVANCLSFTTAAQNLYMTQQAVTKQIAALEEELGVKLLLRTTRSVELTAAGQILRDDFTAINQQIQDSVKKVKSMTQGKQATISIGFLSALSRRWVVLPLTEWLFAQFPQVFFDIRLLNFADLRHQLLDHKLDLCVTTSNDWQLWPNVHVKVLQSKQFDIVYSDRHPLAQLDTVTPDDLAQQVQLTLPKDNTLSGVEQWGRKIPCRQTIHCPDIATLLIRLESGQGFALLTRVFEGCDAPSLHYLPVSFPEAHAEVVCIRGDNANEQTLKVAEQVERGYKPVP